VPAKLTALDGSEWVRHRYPNVWQRERTTGPDRLRIAPDGCHVDVLSSLVGCLPEPFGILYVLIASRAGRESGRYQSPEPWSRGEVVSFLEGFRDYFEGDGRHHVWVTSLPANGTLVYDNHDLIYAYGPIPEYERALATIGLVPAGVSIPAPHGHQYNAEFDGDEDRLMAHCAWIHFPLLPSDDP